MSKTYFTADPHFFHEEILWYCGRPYDSIDEMNRDIISRWNRKVRPEDRVYVLGDVGMVKKKVYGEEGLRLLKIVCDNLNGYKILIKGNHDRFGKSLWKRMGFEEVYKRPISYDSRIFGKIILSHRPVKDEVMLWQYCWNFHGHIHNYYKIRGKYINVGLDVWKFEPVTENEIIGGLVNG